MRKEASGLHRRCQRKRLDNALRPADESRDGREMMTIWSFEKLEGSRKIYKYIVNAHFYECQVLSTKVEHSSVALHIHLPERAHDSTITSPTLLP